MIATIIIMALLAGGGAFFIIRAFLIRDGGGRARTSGSGIIILATVISITAYAAFGNFGKPDAPFASRDFDAPAPVDIAAMVAGLETRLLAEDGISDHEGWAMFIRSSTVIGDEALRDDNIREMLLRMGDGGDGDDVRLLMAVVQILLPPDNLPAEIPAILDDVIAKARSITPDAVEVLFFSGFLANLQGDKDEARKYWEPLLPRLEESNPLRGAIEAALARE